MQRIVLLIFVCTVGIWAGKHVLFAKVIHISTDDSLNVRDASQYKANKIGSIPLGAVVGVNKCVHIQKAEWCQVYSLVQNWYEDFGPDAKGWVNARYLKFSNRGYVIVNGEKNCAYALKCNDSKCEVVFDYLSDEKQNIIKLHTQWIDRTLLKAESSFGAIAENKDGYCNKAMFIEAYLTQKK